MKFKRFSLFIILAVCFSLLGLSVRCQTQQKLSADQEALVKQMKLKAGMEKKPQMLASLAQQIIDDNQALIQLFQDQKFVDMQTLLGKRGALFITPAYEKNYGKESAAFWQKEWGTDKELQLKVASIFLSDAVGLQTVGVMVSDEKGKRIEDVAFDAVATVNLEFHIVQKQEGSVSHNLTIEGSVIYLHRTACPWE